MRIVECAHCSFLAGGIGVKGKDDLCGGVFFSRKHPIEQPDVLIAKCGTAGCHGGCDAGKVAGHNIRVPLYNNYALLLRDIFLGQINSVEHR